MPELIKAKRRATNMAAHARKNMRAVPSPNYQYEAMALTYHRPQLSHMAETVRRSTRTLVPTAAARDATPPMRKVRFAVVPDAIPLLAMTEGLDEEAETTHLPQSFRHGLPRSSLEPCTTNLQYPPSHLFPEPLLGEGGPHTWETPLRIAARLQHFVDDNQKVLAEPKEVLWHKATGHKRYPDAIAPSKAAEKPPAVSDCDRSRISSTAVFLDNTKRVLNVNKCIPHEVIIDTGAVNVILSTKFAKAVDVNFSTLTPGPEFVTAEGKVVAAMGTTPQPLEFVMSSGTP